MPFKDPIKAKEAKRKYRENHRDILRAKGRNYMWKNKDVRRIKEKENYYKNKKIVFDLYGWICNCCHEKNPKFLTIDHVHADGKRHRNAGMRLYQQILKDILIRGEDNYQILCYNCNCSKRLNNNICPHKDI